MILNPYGFYPDTEIVFYDYSKPSLAFKKLLLEQWDGENYHDFVSWALDKYQFNETGGVDTETKTKKQLWEREVKWWGSESAIREHWQEYKKLKHSFIHVDICETPEKITSSITPEKDSLIWWSNAFHTVNAQYLRGLSGVRQCYETWINQIKKQNPDIWILGKDHLDRPVEGTVIKDYVIQSQN